jgi:C1A family cysteine protease
LKAQATCEALPEQSRRRNFKPPACSIESNQDSELSEEEILMKPKSSILVSAVFALANLANAQNPPSGAIQQVTLAQYNQAVQSGQATVINPSLLAQENQQQQAADAQNEAIINAFISQNPNLAGLAALVAAPNEPNVVPTTDGNYTIQVPDASGGFQTVETMGRSVRLAALAGSIQASLDPAQQLALYQSTYTQYIALYGQVCGNAACPELPSPSALIPPSALQNASLGSIKSALKGLTLQGKNIINHLPPAPPEGGPFGWCSTNIGASLMATNGSSKAMMPGEMVFGDQTNSSCSGTGAKDGILANINWPYKNLLTCVKEQGVRGTCHIFAATSAMEELIARDTGSYVNLSEQDFNEHEKLLWHEELFHSGGNPQTDLDDAKDHHYHFAYENQWDYNPSYGSADYENNCLHYPWTLEPGCSDTSPQAPEYTVAGQAGILTYLTPAVLSGPRSPYQSNGATSIWDSDPDLTVTNIIIQLALGNAVVMGFTTSADFDNPTDGYVMFNASQDMTTRAGGHVVHIVAYVDNNWLARNPATKSHANASGGGYFIIKNSWGTCSGDLGYYYMPVDYLQNRASDVHVVVTESH